MDIGKALVAKLGGDYSLMPIQSERELAEQFLKKAEADRADGKTLEILRQAVRWSSPETLSEKEGAEELGATTAWRRHRDSNRPTRFNK